ncbi:RHS repeat domain-containing protein [Planctomycetota bacterium]
MTTSIQPKRNRKFDQTPARNKYTFTYDAEGNLTQRTEKATGNYTQYEYDHRNRLTHAADFDAADQLIGEVFNVYDVFNRLIERTHDPDGAGPSAAETRYTVYDGAHAWADFDGAGNVTARYLFGTGIDQIAARWRPGEGTSWYLTDHLGSIREIIDSNGSIINSISYDSFGQILHQSNPTAGDRFAYTGREWDEALGLYYYRARFFDPTTGRFISQDPIGFAAGDTNLYRYVGNNPLDYVDPSGNLAMTECAFVKNATKAVNTLCPMLQMYLKDSFNYEGLSPEEASARKTENTFQLLNIASSVSPFGSGPAFQFIMKAVTIVQTAKSLAGVLANGHLFTIMGAAETYIREAYMRFADTAYDDIKDGIDNAIDGAIDKAWDYASNLSFKSIMDSYDKIENKGLFWSEVACGAANMALMVYSARARCFVAGTPVVVDVLPPTPADLPDEVAETDTFFEIGRLDWIGGVAIAGAVIAHRRQRKKHEEEQARIQRDLYFAALGEDDNEK